MLLALLVIMPASAGDAQQVTATLDADQVDFSYDRRLVTLTGNAQVFSQIVDDPTQFVRLRADIIEGDLSRGRFELLGEVHIVTTEGTLTGESALFDTRSAEFLVRSAALMAPLTEVAGREVCGFAYAREIVGEDEIVYLVDARFTTCNLVDPHYAFEVNRLRWDMEAEQIVVEGGGIRLYGLRIPLLPRLKYSIGVGPDDGPELLPIPSYSGREGLALGWSFLIGEPEADLSGHAGLRLRQRQGQQAWAWGVAETGGLTARLGASLKENNYQDVDHVISIDRWPEAGVTGDWTLGTDLRLTAGASLGHYRQHAVDALPRVSEDRMLVEALLQGGAERRWISGTSWWWLRASHATYGGGGHYSTLGAGLGGAAALTPWLSGAAELQRHLTDGASPFDWDDIDIETELNARSELSLGPLWRMRFGGRYDVDRAQLRTWNAELRRRAHCLTWMLGYSDTGDFFSIGVEINGLFGNEEPSPGDCSADGAPSDPKPSPDAQEGVSQESGAEEAGVALADDQQQFILLSQ